MNNKIDFVVTWVDGNDKKWRGKRDKYRIDYNIDESRYRDFGFFKYWFRAIEQNAPWVNKIYFVTDNQIPEWLNISHPKLVIVNHEDFIPNEFLPTFNSNAIELGLHRIKGLSDNFVYFNDDVFLNAPCSPADFFINNAPKDIGLFNVITPMENTIDYIQLNNLRVINKYFNKKDCQKKNWKKYFNFYKYRKNVVRSLLLSAWPNFTGFYEPHGSVSYNKSSFEKVWQLEKIKLLSTQKNKFRNLNDLSIWLFRYWQLAEGNFEPQSYDFSKYYQLGAQDKEASKAIENKQYKVICLNDNELIEDPEKIKKIINSSFIKRYPIKSSFEL